MAAYREKMASWPAAKKRRRCNKVISWHRKWLNVNGSYESKSGGMAYQWRWRREMAAAIIGNISNLAWRNALSQRLAKKAQCLAAEIGNGWRSGVI
jgi:hypothetical protein